MKRILFDIVSLQNYHSGGGEYVKIVLNKLLEFRDLIIIGLYDSDYIFLENDLQFLSSKINLVDIKSASLSSIIQKNDIDIFFIGIFQRFQSYNLSGIKCKVVCVVHDIGEIETFKSKLFYLFPRSLKNYLRLTLDYLLPNSRFISTNKLIYRYNNSIDFLLNPNVEIVTVSNYTACALKYYFPKLKNKPFNILYPPIKNYEVLEFFDNILVDDFIKENRKKYILFLNADRPNKNFDLMKDNYCRIKQEFPFMKMVVTSNSDTVEDDVVYFNYLSNSDLEKLYKNAYVLVYISFAEGFGYPPIDSMKYGVPVISSYTCSMPEVLNESVLYVSPFHKSDLFGKFLQLVNNYDEYSSKAELQATFVMQKQSHDLYILLNMLTTLSDND
jgi:glycosyltransferase involved in cell wall biosynthesis